MRDETGRRVEGQERGVNEKDRRRERERECIGKERDLEGGKDEVRDREKG